MKKGVSRILMLLENNYPQDPRVRNEANLLTANGYKVSVIAYKKGNQTWTEDVNGVHVYRIPRVELFKKTADPHDSVLAFALLKIKSFIGYSFEYAYFTTACFLTALYVCLTRGFDAIHAHNPPDTLFLVALPFRFIGKKFVFDHHDLCPELYQSRYNSGKGLFTKMLGFFEWCSLKTAHMTIATNESYKEIQIQRGGRKPETIFIVRNGPNEQRMKPHPPSERLRKMNKKILVYIGSLNPQDGVDYLLRALGKLLHDLRREDFYCVVMGSGDSLEDLRTLAKDLKLDGYVELTGYVTDQELMENLSAADICVDPDPSSPLNDVSTWIKVMEYMAHGKPIVTFDLKETRYSAQDAAVYVQPNDEAKFAAAVAKMMDEPEERKRKGEFGRRRVEQELQWSVVGKNLLAGYAALQ